VPDVEIPPVLLEILRDQPPMAVVWLVLAAQEASAFDHPGIDPLFDFPFLHQVQKCGLVDAPIPFMFLVGIENICRWCEQGHVDVINANDFLEEILDVIPLRKPSELRNIIKAHIDDALGAAFA